MTKSLAGQSRMLFVAMVAVIFASVCSAIATDPVQARKDIKAMGMEYTGQDFAKAAGNGDMTAVQLFLDAGMDMNSGGGAAIGLAAGRGKTEMVKFLLSKGAKPTLGRTAICADARPQGYREDSHRCRREGVNCCCREAKVRREVRTELRNCRMASWS